MTEQVMTYGDNTEQEKPLQRWVKRIWNVVPSRKAVWGAVKYCVKNFMKKTRNAVMDDCKSIAGFVKRCCQTLGAFSTYNIQTPEAKATDCPLDEMPIIVKIESIGGKGRHFHGAMAYGDVAIDSNGAGQNGPKDGKMEAPVDTKGSYFVLYPSRLGIDSKKLAQAMYAEAMKQNDYDFYLNNCIDHIIRPMKEAGAKLDFGQISTPKELCQWCDKMCFQENAGVVLNEAEYQNLLNRLDMEKTIPATDLKFMHILSALQKPIQQASLKEKTAEYSEQFPCGKDVSLLQERISDYPEKFACGQAVVRLANRRKEYPEQFPCGQVIVQVRNNPTKKIQNNVNQLAYGY